MTRHGWRCAVTLAKEIHFVDDIQTRADRFIESSFGDEPFLAIHIRRGVDRLHEFCKSSEANECYGWPVGVHSNCYPPIKAVAAKIKRMLSWHNLSRAFLATDSPDARIFEDILKNEHGAAVYKNFLWRLADWCSRVVQMSISYKRFPNLLPDIWTNFHCLWIRP